MSKESVIPTAYWRIENEICMTKDGEEILLEMKYSLFQLANLKIQIKFLSVALYRATKR